jgi:phage tail-like protein
MPVRDRPYPQFNFLVDLGTGDTTSVKAGFQECSNVGMEVTVAEYRAGNELQNNVRKITGLNKASDVTLKRGIIGARDLYEWLDTIRQGSDRNLGMRQVSITLRAEDRTTDVLTWRLMNARIIKYVSGPFNAKGTDVAMEELTLAYERLEVPEAG